MGQHCTGQNPMQCCPGGSRQHCKKKKKILCNFALTLFGQHCTGQNSMQCCPKDSRKHCIRKNPVQCCLITLGATLHSWKPYAILPECNVVPNTSSNISQENIQATQAMFSEQRLVTLFTYVDTRFFNSKKYKKVMFLYYENWLKLTLKQQPDILPSNRSNF